MTCELGAGSRGAKEQSVRGEVLGTRGAASLLAVASK